MTLGNMRRQGVHHLIAYCLNDACRHQALIDVSGYPGAIEVPEFGKRAKCGKCGGKRVDVRPNWKEKPGMPDSWSRCEPPASIYASGIYADQRLITSRTPAGSRRPL
jgi:hypothetical protein